MKFLNRDKTIINSENVATVLVLIFGIVFPFFGTTYHVNLFSNFYASILLCFSLTLIWGYCGIFSFAQAALYGLGAYLYGIFAGNMPSPAYTPLALLLAVVIVWLFSLVLGYFMFYGGVNDVFIGIITLCLTLALNTFFGQTAGTKWTVGNVAIGGYNGMVGIPTLTIGNFTLMGLPFYYLTFALAAITLLFFNHLRHTKAGYTMFAIRENKERSEMFGYNAPKIQMIVFSVGGAMAAIAGVLYASWGGYVSPDVMNTTQATVPVIVVAAGGKASPVAAMIFGLIYYYVTNGFAATGNEYSFVILGIALILVTLFMPQGLFKSLFDFLDSKFFSRIKAFKTNNVEKKNKIEPVRKVDSTDKIASKEEIVHARRKSECTT